MSEIGCRVVSTRRVFPATALQEPTVTKLSIIDASIARLSPCGATWFYDRAEGIDVHDPLLFRHLEEALRQTLDDYPHYAGQLQWATKEQVAGDANPRHTGRPVVVYSTPADPGIELVIAEDSRELSSLVPSLEERSTTKLWNATDFPQDDFLPKTPIALSPLASFTGRPAMAAQLTAFACGGFAVGVKIAHCLSDAMCLLQFVHAWAARSQTLFGAQDAAASVSVKTPAKPLFDPAQLDQHAGLTADGLEPDAEKVRKARALPMHRFDWWATGATGYPSWALPSSKATMPPPEELRHLELSPSTHPPWPTWNAAALVEHVQIRFGAEEVARLKGAAENSLPEALHGQRISRQDAVLGLIWILINRARQQQHHTDNNNNNNNNNQDEPVYMDITLGLRSRVDPPLPDSFVGSPILLGYISKPTGFEASTAPLGSVAGSIRQMMSRFTPDAMAAYLHDAAHEVSPQRLWQAFLGSRHTLVTSWARARAYEVDFFSGFGEEEGRLARYVQGMMPKMDGLVQVMDVADTGDFDISLCLEKEAMQRLVRDPVLRAFEGKLAGVWGGSVYGRPESNLSQEENEPS
ncbi:Uu.00g011260.m01.CDS01 [Anthostomella pinea]|uniref:Uu.00g011260.m01.CDS01 n=1 Tax=Anthostomella pinea TaxID=933095 RepID=A0AAI8YMS7_9PEZI|nr:Uu.00g011260.m01.CDS01 [Anthostomella pinea]